MNGHDIAERFANRPGFRLVDYIEVALPVYSVAVQTSTLLRKRISPLEEFVMRCLKAGLSNAGEVSRFLGLDAFVVNSVLGGLVQQNDVALVGLEGMSTQTLKLTTQGERTLTEAETIVPED